MFVDGRKKAGSLFRWTAITIFLATTFSSVTLLAQDPSPSATAGQALSLMFDSHRAPPAKSMGLLQGNFLDAIDVQGSLQLALVIDDSESMEDQIVSIRENLSFLIADLNRVLDGSVEFAAVTYSDIGNKPVPVTIHNTGFVNAETIKTTIDGLKVNNGQPYFPETPDLGIHRTISELPWSNESGVEKWVLLIGDAPPYEPSFNDPDTGAKRWYGTDFLVDMANQKGLKIHCLLCNSREEEKDSFERLLDDTRSFMNTISSGTGGLMLDMSYAQVRKTLASNASRIRTEYVRVGHITERDVEAARGGDSEIPNANASMRVVVLPFLPMADMSFFHQNSEVQIATEFRTLLKQLPNTRVVSPREIETEIDKLKSEGIAPKDWPQALMFRLRAQLVVMGQLKNTPQGISAAIEVRGQKTAEQLASVMVTASAEDLVRQIIAQLAQTRARSSELSPFIQRLIDFVSKNQIELSEIGTISKLDPMERQLLLAGLSALERASGYSRNDLNSMETLQAAEQSLGKFLETNRKHPYAGMLASNAKFNLASAYESMGMTAEAKAKFRESKKAIQRAFQGRTQLVDQLVRLELEGDYLLLIRKDYPGCIEKYQTILLQSEKSMANSSLHANWMLAGIRAGDWGVEETDKSVVDLNAARGHLVQILAHWPGSYQADLIKQNMMWDKRENKSRTPYFAHLTKMFASSR